MNLGEIKYRLGELRYFHLFPRRYSSPKGMSREDWTRVSREYANMMKRIECSDYHWRVITYDDGRKELAYLRVLRGGLFSGMSPAIYRGPVIPHIIKLGTFAHITNIRLAF